MSQSFFPIIPPNTTDGTYAFTPQFTLSNQKSVLGLGFPQRSLSPSVNTVEITFSPQNDIDNFIKSPGNLPNFDIGTYIGDPSQTFLPYYPNLQAAAASLLVNNDLDASTYIRLIKYFDNSLFNMIKDFVPARTNLKSGITIKPHLLERSKIVQPRAFISSSIYSGSTETGFIKGGTGGTFDDYNSLTPRLNNTQSWYQDILTPLGLTRSFHTDQAEFYNGELPYYPTEAFTADGDLNVSNPYKYAPAPVTADAPRYIVTYTYSNTTRLSTFIQNNLPSNGNISVWVRREPTGTFTGIPPAQVTVYRYTIEYIKTTPNPILKNINSNDIVTGDNAKKQLTPNTILNTFDFINDKIANNQELTPEEKEIQNKFLDKLNDAYNKLVQDYISGGTDVNNMKEDSIKQLISSNKKIKFKGSYKGTEFEYVLDPSNSGLLAKKGDNVSTLFRIDKKGNDINKIGAYFSRGVEISNPELKKALNIQS
jgi:hypothetical protein